MNDEWAERGRFLREFDAMLYEGVPPDDLIHKIGAWARQDADRLQFLGEGLEVLYQNVVENSQISEDEISAECDDSGEPGVYREMRDSGRIVRASIDIAKSSSAILRFTGACG